MEKNKAYEKLTPEQKQIMELVMNNLDNGVPLWKQGWITSTPESAVTRKKYRGSNNFYLTLVSIARNYDDNRWVTYKQMQEHGWSFKTDEDGKSLGKGSGVNVEFFSLRDKETKKPFNKSVLDGMTIEEQHQYMKDNVYPVRKTYRVFNGSIIDGIPEQEFTKFNPEDRIPRIDNFLADWSKNESEIVHGGEEAYYRVSNDVICLPEMKKFVSMQEYYSTAMHEVGHSTGHETRLNRNIKNMFGTQEYAIEELRAEIASLFLGQEFGITIDENSVRNNSAYIKAWKDKLTEDPSALFTAITDADKISRYVIAKEQEFNKSQAIEYYAIKQDKNDYDDIVFKAYMISEYGQVRQILGYAFESRDALMKEFNVMKGLTYWSNKEFVEVSFDELQEKSIALAKAKDIEEEKSNTYIRPSEIVAQGVAVTLKSSVDMSERGIESLTRMSDREVVERASKTKNGQKFLQLYNGLSVLGNEEKDEYSLMTRLAMFCDGDKDRLMRVFKSSGQYREEKPNSFYEGLAEKSIKFLEKLKNPENTIQNTGRKFSFGKNFKS